MQERKRGRSGRVGCFFICSWTICLAPKEDPEVQMSSICVHYALELIGVGLKC